MSRYKLLDPDGTFEAFPNGHKMFLTPTALQKLNSGRKDAEIFEKSDLLGPAPCPNKKKRGRAYMKGFPSRSTGGAPLLPGKSLLPGRGKRVSGYHGSRRRGRSKGGFVTEEDWIQDPENKFVSSYEVGKESSTSIPEMPTLLGDMASGGLTTLRLRALKGKEIDVCPGSTISLRVTGKGPRNGSLVSLQVEDVVYGANAYVNLLVDGGTTASRGGRSTSRSDAYIRAVRSSV